MISSPSNQAIKHIRALASRKERERTGLFFIEGIRIVAEAARQRADVESLVVAHELLTSEFARRLVREITEGGIPALEVTPRVFASISLKEGPQGIGAVVRQRWHPLRDAGPGDGLCWVALDTVADPGNLGAILRSCDAVGAAGVMLVGTSTDPHDPTAVRASMGAIFSQRLVRTTIEELASWKREHSIFSAGTSDAADSEYDAISYRQPLILFMGSERQGLSEEAQNMCDVIARIPMVGRSDSLNLAVATGIMLYEIFNQRRREEREL